MNPGNTRELSKVFFEGGGGKCVDGEEVFSLSSCCVCRDGVCSAGAVAPAFEVGGPVLAPLAVEKVGIKYGIGIH